MRIILTRVFLDQIQDGLRRFVIYSSDMDIITDIFDKRSKLKMEF